MEKSRRGVLETFQKNLSRKHQELSERRREFARKKWRGKRAERKAARTKHEAARARSWLDELMFGTFNVPTAAVNGVDGIGHIDTLLRPYAAKGCDVIGLQNTKRNGLPKSWHLDTTSTSAVCSGVKGRKGQHGVGLAIEEEIVKKAGKVGISIKCISERFLKARIPIKLHFVTFVVAYAPTEEAPEGQKGKYLPTLNSTVASVPAWDTSSFWPTPTPGQGREVREAGKQTAKCWTHIAETCSTKTANYCWVLQKTISSLSWTLYFAPPNVAYSTHSKAQTAVRDRHVWTISWQGRRTVDWSAASMSAGLL